MRRVRSIERGIMYTMDKTCKYVQSVVKTLMLGVLNKPTKSCSTPHLQPVRQVEVEIASEARV